MFFARKGVPMVERPHLEQVCDALESVVCGEITRLIINIPPRSGKTEVGVKAFVSWAMGHFPESEFIHASYSKRLATANTYAVRAIMQHDFYQSLFQTRIKQDSTAKDEFRTTAGGIVYATGAEGTITGYGAGTIGSGFGGGILIDDAHKAGEADSPVMRRNVIDWFQETMESRKNSPDTPIIVIGQRLHEEDLPGWLLAGGNGEEWNLLKVPAMNEGGESFWPDQFPVSMLSRLEKASPYNYAGQYQQEPAPKGGGFFKPHNIDIIDALPRGVNWVRGWDMAATADGGDWTVGAKVGVKDGVTYIADIRRQQAGPDEVERLVVSTAQMDDCKQSLPQDPGAAGKSVVAYMSKKLAGQRFEFTPETGSKTTRAEPIAAQINVGNVMMLRARWNEVLVHELASFPNGSHDDIVDAMSRAYNALTSQKSAGVW